MSLIDEGNRPLFSASPAGLLIIFIRNRNHRLPRFRDAAIFVRYSFRLIRRLLESSS